jgi:hypothetical protein
MDLDQSSYEAVGGGRPPEYHPTCSTSRCAKSSSGSEGEEEEREVELERQQQRQ